MDKQMTKAEQKAREIADLIFAFKDMVRLELSVASSKEAFLDRKDQVTVRDTMRLVDRIEELEAKLEETQIKLGDAYAEIESLTRESDK